MATMGVFAARLHLAAVENRGVVHLREDDPLWNDSPAAHDHWRCDLSAGRLYQAPHDEGGPHLVVHHGAGDPHLGAGPVDARCALHEEDAVLALPAHPFSW